MHGNEKAGFLLKRSEGWVKLLPQLFTKKVTALYCLVSYCIVFIITRGKVKYDWLAISCWPIKCDTFVLNNLYGCYHQSSRGGSNVSAFL